MPIDLSEYAAAVNSALAEASPCVLATQGESMPDIGFKSVGRGRPLAASVQGMREVGPSWVREFGQRHSPVVQQVVEFDGDCHVTQSLRGLRA